MIGGVQTVITNEHTLLILDGDNNQGRKSGPKSGRVDWKQSGAVGSNLGFTSHCGSGEMFSSISMKWASGGVFVKKAAGWCNGGGGRGRSGI